MDEIAYNKMIKKCIENSPTKLSKELAGQCWEADKKFNSALGGLHLEWMIDYYLVNELEKRTYPRFKELIDYLEKNEHTQKNKAEHFKGRIYLIPHSKLTVMVMENEYFHQEGGYLIVDSILGPEPFMWQTFKVRKIYPKLHDNGYWIDKPTLSYYKKFDFDIKKAVRYGDARDPGHVLTYEKTNEEIGGSCNKVSWDMHTPFLWCFILDSVWTELIYESKDE